MNDGLFVYVLVKLVNLIMIECDVLLYSVFVVIGMYILVVSISFEGYSDDRSAFAMFFENFIWVGGMVNYMYYDLLNFVVMLVMNLYVFLVLFMGEVLNGDLAVIVIDGGLFVDGVFKC